MSGPRMLDRTTLSPRRVAVAVLLALVAVSALTALALVRPGTAPDGGSASPEEVAAGPQPDAPRVTSSPPASAKASPTTSPSSSASPSGRSVQVGDDPGSALPPMDEVSPELEIELAEAQQRASDFAVGIYQYRYDDTPASVLGRVRPFATEALATTLAQREGGAAVRQEMVAREEQAVAQVETVQVQGATETEADVLVVLRQSIVTSDGTRTENPTVLVRMVKRPEGWVAEGFTP